MAKTQAERAREYRNRQRGTTRAKREGQAPRMSITAPSPPPERDGVTVKRDGNVTAKCDARHENVTVPERDAPSVTDLNKTIYPPAPKPTFDDLPSDVQASIESMCAENNNGQRADSHSRAAMTERALSYQSMFGKRSSQGVV